MNQSKGYSTGGGCQRLESKSAALTLLIAFNTPGFSPVYRIQYGLFIVRDQHGAIA